MSDNVRFHSKHHGKAHHSDSTGGYHDSAIDPIANSTSPFKGDFYLSGGLYNYSQYLTSIDGGQSFVDLASYFTKPGNNALYDAAYSTVNSLSTTWGATGAIRHLTLTGKASAYDYELQFPVQNVTNILVSIEGVIQTPTTHYSVSADASRSNYANIKLATKPSNDESISVTHLALSSVPAGLWTTDGTHVYRETGRVGIGTAAPTALLHLSAAGGEGDLMFVPGGDSSQIHTKGSLWVGIDQNGNSATASFAIFNDGDSGNMLFKVLESGYVGIGAIAPTAMLHVSGASPDILLENQNAGAVAYQIKNTARTWHVGSDNSPDNFYIRDHTQTTDRLVITSAGKVGIGTTAPTSLLHLSGGGSPVLTISSPDAQGRTIQFNDAGAMAAQINCDSSENLEFMTGGSATPKAIILANGKVGIGTTAPTKALDVREFARVWDGTNGVELSYSTGNSSGVLAAANTGGNLEFRTNVSGTTKMFIASGGNVGIGTTVPISTLTVAGTISAHGVRITDTGRVRIACANYEAQPSASNHGVELFNTNSSCIFAGGGTGIENHFTFFNLNGQVGGVQTNGSSTSFNTSSDYRLKENNVLISDGIARLKTLKPYKFNFKADNSVTVDGFFAHEVTAVPEATSGEKDAVDEEGEILPQGIDQSKLVPLLTAALQETLAKVEALEIRIEQLEG